MNILNLKRLMRHYTLMTDGDGVGGASGMGGNGGDGSGDSGSSSDGYGYGGSDGSGHGMTNSGLEAPSVGAYASQTPGQMSAMDVTMNILSSTDLPGWAATGLANLATLGGKTTASQTMANVAGILTGLPIGMAYSVANKLGLSFDGTTVSQNPNSPNQSVFSGNQQASGNAADSTFKPSDSVADLAAGAANSQSPAELADRIAADSWSQWGEDKTALQAKVDTAETRGNALYDTSQQVADEQLGTARQMNKDYDTVYRPFQAQQAAYVNKLGTQAYRDEVRGKAASDVQQQADAQLSIAQRNQQRQGVNPSSGRALALSNQNAIGTALGKTAATATAERGANADWASGLNTMNTNGLNLQKQSLANSDSAGVWSKTGLSAGATGLGLGMDLSKLGTGTAQTVGGISNGSTSAKTSAASVNNQASQYANSNDLGNIATNAAVGYGVSALGSWLTS